MTLRSIATTILLALSVFCLASMIFGCGNGTSHTSVVNGGRSARLTITVKWPKRGRLIPEATASIKIDIINKAVAGPANIVTTTTIPQGQTTTTISPLPAATLTMTATALDANGAAAAQGSQDVTTQVNQTAQVTINMNSTIDRLVVTPANPIVNVGSALQLQASGVNTIGEMVLLTPSRLEWQPVSANDATVVTVDAQSGIVTGVKQGTADIQVTDTESHISVTVTVNVGQSLVGNYVGYFSWNGGKQVGLSTFTIYSDDGTTVTANYVVLNNGFSPYPSFSGPRTGNHVLLQDGAQELEGDIVNGVFTGTNSWYGSAATTGAPPGPLNYNSTTSFQGNQFAGDYSITDTLGLVNAGMRVNPDGSIITGDLSSTGGNIENGSGSANGGSFTLSGTLEGGINTNVTLSGNLAKGTNGVTGTGTWSGADGSSGIITVSSIGQ